MDPLNLTINEITDRLASDIGLTKIRQIALEVRDRYRDKSSAGKDLEIIDHDRALAYVIYRLPATALVIYEVMGRLKETYGGFKPKTLLDLGSGPATAVLAVREAFGTEVKFTLLEEQKAMRGAGEGFLAEAGIKPGNISWVDGDFQKFKPDEKYDLVLASYMANELQGEEIDRLCEAVDLATEDTAVIIVPGVPEHFHKLLRIRQLLLSRGFHILAPCTFTGNCPMADRDDWCHFSKRVNRSKALKYIKSGDLSHEDEKFAYLILSRKAVAVQGSRIIRHPQIHKGFFELELCSKLGITQQTLSKGKTPADFKRGKNLSWGDLF